MYNWKIKEEHGSSPNSGGNGARVSTGEVLERGQYIWRSVFYSLKDAESLEPRLHVAGGSSLSLKSFIFSLLSSILFLLKFIIANIYYTAIQVSTPYFEALRQLMTNQTSFCSFCCSTFSKYKRFNSYTQGITKTNGVNHFSSPQTTPSG